MNPFALMRRMTEEMDRAFGDFGIGRSHNAGHTWVPAIEVAERDGKYLIHADLPGLKREDVKVEVIEDALVVQGERKFEHEEDRNGIHRSERRYGRFYRSLPLPQGVKPDEIQAKFENGVLEVTAPLPQQQNSRRQIPIQAASTSQPNA